MSGGAVGSSSTQYKVRIDEYLSPAFRPENVANQLMRDTTTAQDSTVDINPALTRLKYDIEEIEAKMKALCRDNADSLLEHTEATKMLNTEIRSLQPSLENMTGTYAKLERDFLEPYNRASRLQMAGEKLSYTAQLSRSLSWYLQLALQAQSQEYRREGVISSGGAGAAMVRTAHAFRNIAKLVNDVPDLKRINAVGRFEERLPDLRSGVVDSATRIIKEFDGIHPVQMKMAALAIELLNSDLLQIVESHIRALVGISVLQLSRNNGSVPDLEKSFADAEHRNKLVTSLSAVCNEVKSSSAVSKISDDVFWTQVAAQLDQKFKTMSVANPGALRNMISNKTGIFACTQVVPSLHDVFAKYLNK